MSELAGLGTVIGALLAGIALQKTIFHEDKNKYIKESLNLLSFGFLILFFFIYIGINFEWMVIFNHPWLVIFILTTATFGKILGTIASKPFLKLKLKQLYLINWGMNSRGVMELVIASLAVTAGLISADLYSTIVFMTIATTILFPYVVKLYLTKYPDIFN